MFKVLKAYLGWSNKETDGGADLRLYALDRGSSPRWDNSRGSGGRTVERAILEYTCNRGEGDLYLIVRLGDRFVTDEYANQVTRAIELMLGGGDD